MKKAKKISLTIAISVISIFLIIGLLTFILFLSFSSNSHFEKNKLINTNLKIDVYDSKNNLISDKNMFNNQYVKLENINQETIDAFISIEDKNFYNHNGINIKRIGGALIKNILNGKTIQGASTISQQLIKNTHLTSEKTYSRKLKEIILALQMEKSLSKDEILENYLNVIYFGNNIYGIENASQFYFSKSTNELNLEESALLAGIIKSPANYCPINNTENCLKRRNLVLSEMQKDGKITIEQKNSAIKNPIKLIINENFDHGQNSYSQCAIEEASKILKIPAKQIALAEYKIYTHFNLEKQKALIESVNNQELSFDQAGISINNKTRGVEAFYAKSAYSVLKTKRQPGSTIKPILVYGPAINENILSPATKILDEEININGYSPNNYSKNYSGYVSVREAISKSINIPAVKTLSYVGIPKAKRYCERLGIKFDENDNGYALALGGMTFGTDLKTLTGAYTIFANNGNFIPASFITKITDKNGKVLYTPLNIEDQVLREDSNFLTLSTLQTCAKEGTAKKLSSLPYMVAAKTGTVGNNINNSDAYSIALTQNDTVGIWIGDLKNNNIGNLTGGNQPTAIIKTYFNKIYKTNTPKDFDMPSSVQKVEIDSIELEKNNIILKANDYIPKRYIVEEIFSRFNLPKEKSTNFLKLNPAQLSGKVENSNYILEFEAENFLTYELYRVDEPNDVLIKTFGGQDGKITFTIPKTSNKTKFYIISKIKNYATNQEISSEKSNLIEFINTNSSQTKTQKSKWYV